MADDDRTGPQRRHDGLEVIAEFFLDHLDGAGASHHRPHVNIVVDRSVLRDGTGVGVDLGTGVELTAEECQQIACDANLHRVYRAGSTTIDYGRSTRSIPAPLFTAVAIRDGGCRFPGCDRPPQHTRGHHVRFWDHGGPTDQTNIILVCALHHWLIHKRRWTVTLDPHDATTTWTRPDGTTRTSRPCPRTGGTDDIAV